MVKRFFHLWAGLLLTALWAPVACATGDTAPDINAVYPAGAFAPPDAVTNSKYWNGTNVNKVLNIQTHFGALGNNNPASASANTTAFRAMFNFLKARQVDSVAKGNGNTVDPSAQWIIYIPNGVYYVNNWLSYTGATDSTFRGVRLIGQSRSNTVIKLVDKCAGFGVGANVPVLSFESPSQDFNNWQAHNFLRNITIDVGNGNPGAIGVNFVGANSARIDNVLIRSPGGTNKYAGAVGLNCWIGIVHGYYSNLAIDGFDVGIQLVPYHHCCPSLEHVTLTNQKIAGIKALDGGASFRDVLSVQNRTDAGADAMGVLIDSGSSSTAGAHVVLVDSVLYSTRSTASRRPAIYLALNNNVAGHLFARHVVTSGYTNSVTRGAANAVAGDIGEYVSDATFAFNQSSPKLSMNLPVREVPFVGWETNTNNWASPDDYGAVGDGIKDDTASVQKALNSGKPVIYFPKQVYLISSPLDVPATVKRIDLMATALNGSPGYYFGVKSGSPNPLLLHDLNDAASSIAKLTGKRTLILDSNRQGNLQNGTTTHQDVFVNNCNTFLRYGSLTALTNMSAWCRFIDTEDKRHPNWTVQSNGVMWVLGFKCEGITVNYSVEPGGVLEVLGGIINQYDQNSTQAEWDQFNTKKPPYNAANVNFKGNFSLVACNSGPTTKTGFTNLVGDVQGKVTNLLTKAMLPPRTGRIYQAVVPLYTSYSQSQVIRSATTFEPYLGSHGLEAAAPDGAPTADPDGDGLCNWLEYLVGSDPATRNASPMTLAVLPATDSQPRQLQITYPRLIAASALLLAVEASTDMTAWKEVVADVDGVTVGTASLDQNRDQVTLTLPLSQQTRFFRLRGDLP